MKENIKYSWKKMWYIASFVRGMSIDEAITQLKFIQRKGAYYAIETLQEAQELAVKEHNVEFKSNLWVSESFCGKGFVVKGVRRHAKDRVGKVEYHFTHYFVTLEEGKPPKDYYYYKREKTGEEMFEEWLQKMRNRRISNSL